MNNQKERGKQLPRTENNCRNWATVSERTRSKTTQLCNQQQTDQKDVLGLGKMLRKDQCSPSNT